MERDRAVWTAAHDTISGKIRPMIRRIQTKNAHDPLSAANGATSAGPGAGRDPEGEQPDLDGEDAQQQARHQDERRLGQLRRHQVPVAQDHRGEDAADRRREEGQLEQEPDRRSAAPRQRAEDQDEESGRQRGEARVAPDRTAAQHEEVDRTDQDERGEGGPPRGIERRVRDDRRVAERGRQGPSENHASTPNRSAQIVVKRTNPGVAEVRQRASNAIAYAPTASPVSTVQLM